MKALRTIIDASERYIRHSSYGKILRAGGKDARINQLERENADLRGRFKSKDDEKTENYDSLPAGLSGVERNIALLEREMAKKRAEVRKSTLNKK